MTGPRDWDKEMAEIDKLIASGRTAPASGAPATPARSTAARASVPAALASGPVMTRSRDNVGVWLRALIGLGGAVALQVWPYGKGCGTMLYLYLAASFVVASIGAWTMRGAWTHRRGFAHITGLIVLLASVVFAGIQILERTGYAAVRLGWTCP